MTASSDNSLSGISLTTYDMVVAITQVAINETMGEYLVAQSDTFAIYGIADDNGKITALASDPSKANAYLKGTLTLEKDASQQYINIIDLYTEKGNQTVRYSITMKNAEFHFNAGGLSYEKKQLPTDGPWVFKLFVNLSMQDVEKSNLPDSLRQQLENVDENMFSIQQLYMDLNTAALDSIDGVTFPALVQTPAQQLLTLYLQQQQEASKPLFGVSVKFKDSTVLPPSLTPTFVDFAVTPYTDKDGSRTNPALDTLNYLVMFNHNPPPSNQPTNFGFNWATDEQIQGVMAVKQSIFSSYVVPQLNPLLKTLCPVMYVKADGTQSPPNDVQIKLNPGVDHSFDLAFISSTGQTGSCSYNTSDSNTDKGPWYAPYTYEVSGSYSMNCYVALGQEAINLTGAITASAKTFSAVDSSSNEVDMPDTTYNWSVDLQLYFDAEVNGQLDVKIVNPNFNQAPVVAGHDQSWWETFLQSLGGYMVSYTNDLGDLRGTVSGIIVGNIQSNLTTLLAHANHFIFPGAKTFTFKNPQFSNTKDLVSNITYLNPNG